MLQGSCHWGRPRAACACATKLPLQACDTIKQAWVELGPVHVHNLREAHQLTAAPGQLAEWLQPPPGCRPRMLLL